MGNLISKIALTATSLLQAATTSHAQITNSSFSERYGNTFNVAAGAPYFKNWGAAPYITVNYEFLVNNNFTIAPFAGIVSFRTSYFEGVTLVDYRERVIPMGIKATYYFDNLLNLGPNWDLYAAASVGYLYHDVSWNASYSAGVTIKEKAFTEVEPMYLDLHIGAEYHLSRRTGIIADVSRGVSTVGIALHKVPRMPKKRR